MTFSILVWVYPFDFVPHYMSSSPVVYQPRLTWNTGLYACVVGASQAVLAVHPCSRSYLQFVFFRVCVMCLRTTTESKGGNRPVSYCSPTLTWYDSAPSLCVLFDALLCPHTPNYTDSTLALHTHTLSSCLNSQGLSHTGLDWLVTPGNHRCIPRHVGLWWLAFYW